MNDEINKISILFFHSLVNKNIFVIYIWQGLWSYWQHQSIFTFNVVYYLEAVSVFTVLQYCPMDFSVCVWPLELKVSVAAEDFSI